MWPTARMPSGPAWDRNGPCASPIPTSPASVVSRTISSLTRLIVDVDVRTGWGRETDSMYVSSALIFIRLGAAAMILQRKDRSARVHVVLLPVPFGHVIVAAPQRRGSRRMN